MTEHRSYYDMIMGGRHSRKSPNHRNTESESRHTEAISIEDNKNAEDNNSENKHKEYRHHSERKNEEYYCTEHLSAEHGRAERRKHKKSGHSSGTRVKQLEKTVLAAVSARNYRPMRAKDLAYLLSIPKAAGSDFDHAVGSLMDKGKIEKDKSGFLVAVKNAGRSSRSSAPSRDLEGYTKKERRTAELKPLLEGIESTDLLGVVLANNIPTEFPPKVLKAAERIPDHLTEADYSNRLDLRDKMIITIDGDDSKDFDDAVSLEKSGSGYILGVHIADVTHYVPDGSAIDKEALARGTSVYLPDRVIPMLPEKLSNGICSLNEGEDRLTLSVIAVLDKDAHVIRSRIAESVICSSHRMTYSKVDRIFEGDKELAKEYSDIVPMLFAMKDVAAKMEQIRHERGMIDFSFPETKFELDENGRPVRIYPSWPTTATKLIEQFMLTANEIVAKKYFDRNLPFVYRNHERPDSEKMENALTALREAGVKVQKKGYHITPLEVQQIVTSTEGTPEESLTSTMLLRAMQQARYGTENLGHFGLASKCYCHFTSPIRRYPDLQIHRIIKDDLNGRLAGRKITYYRRILDDVAWKSSALERRSVEAEREADKVKMTEYVRDHIGEVTEGIITGVTNWGFYVQRPDTVEGLVPASSLGDDYYEFDERTMTLRGKRHGRVFRLGQSVYVKTVRANVARRMIDFELADPEEEVNPQTDV